MVQHAKPSSLIFKDGPGQYTFVNPKVAEILSVDAEKNEATVEHPDDGQITVSMDKLRLKDPKSSKEPTADRARMAFSHKDNKALFNNLKVMSEAYGKMKDGKPLNQREKYWFKGRDANSLEKEMVETIAKILRNSILLGSKKKINPSKDEFHKMFDLKKVALDNLDMWKKKTSAKEVLGELINQYFEGME